MPTYRVDRLGEQLPRGIAAPEVRTELRKTFVIPQYLVRWDSIAVGTAAGLATTVLLSMLGHAIGASAFEPGAVTADWFTWAGVWGVITAAAFVIAGWPPEPSRSPAPRPASSPSGSQRPE